jgi:hemerythrin-like domain-containing protein
MSRSLLELLEEGDEETLQKTNRLQEVLTHLRYEGKASLGKNLKETNELLLFFDRDLVEHVRREEEVIFPYLAAHIPKLGLLVSLLRSEHTDFRINLAKLKFWLRELRKNKSGPSAGKMLEKVKETGIYLAYLLQSHVQEEGKILYDIASRELSLKERTDLARKIGWRRL